MTTLPASEIFHKISLVTSSMFFLPACLLPGRLFFVSALRQSRKGAYTLEEATA